MIRKEIIAGKELVFDSDKHRYWLNGVEAPAVTTIVGQLDKSNQLVWWNSNLIVEYLHDEFDKFTSGEMELNPENTGRILSQARVHHEELREKAADLGSRAHRLIEADLNIGEFTEKEFVVDDDLEPSYSAYLNWKESFEIFKPIATEIMTYGDYPCLYAGTADWIINLDNRILLGDIKTSKAIYPEYLIQLSAYRKSLTETNGIEIESMGILRLDKVTGIPEWMEFSDAQYKLAFRIFKHLCKVWHYRRDLKI
jgi:hypothetical protein